MTTNHLTTNRKLSGPARKAQTILNKTPLYHIKIRAEDANRPNSRRAAKQRAVAAASDFFRNAPLPKLGDALLHSVVDSISQIYDWQAYHARHAYNRKFAYSDDQEDTGDSSNESPESGKNGKSTDVTKPTKPVKLYVTSGLFSVPRRGTASPTKPLLPLPADPKILSTSRPFKLPWNIFCPSTEGERKLLKWKSMRKNQWIDCKPQKAAYNSRPACSCTVNCGEDCLNRMLQWECDSAICPFGSADCGNRQFAVLARELQKNRRYAQGYEIFQTESRGFGLRAIRSYAPGQLIVEYTGDIISSKEVNRRLSTVYRKVRNYYFLNYDKGYVLDAGLRGSAAKFANHSCAPNAEMQKWHVKGVARIGLFAGPSGISPGEEITYDYNFDWFEGAEAQECLCGAPNCRGIIGKRSGSESDSKRRRDESASASVSPEPRSEPRVRRKRGRKPIRVVDDEEETEAEAEAARNRKRRAVRESADRRRAAFERRRAEAVEVKAETIAEGDAEGEGDGEVQMEEETQMEVEAQTEAEPKTEESEDTETAEVRKLRRKRHSGSGKSEEEAEAEAEVEMEAERKEETEKMGRKIDTKPIELPQTRNSKSPIPDSVPITTETERMPLRPSNLPARRASLAISDLINGAGSAPSPSSPASPASPVGHMLYPAAGQAVPAAGPVNRGSDVPRGLPVNYYMPTNQFQQLPVAPMAVNSGTNEPIDGTKSIPKRKYKKRNRKDRKSQLAPPPPPPPPPPLPQMNNVYIEPVYGAAKDGPILVKVYNNSPGANYLYQTSCGPPQMSQPPHFGPNRTPQMSAPPLYTINTPYGPVANVAQQNINQDYFAGVPGTSGTPVAQPVAQQQNFSGSPTLNIEHYAGQTANSAIADPGNAENTENGENSEEFADGSQSEDTETSNSKHKTGNGRISHLPPGFGPRLPSRRRKLEATPRKKQKKRDNTKRPWTMHFKTEGNELVTRKEAIPHPAVLAGLAGHAGSAGSAGSSEASGSVGTAGSAGSAGPKSSLPVALPVGPMTEVKNTENEKLQRLSIGNLIF